MGDANIFISNGTCYSASGKELDKSFIPCGNDAFGHQTCCGAGDNCLGDRACFGIHGTGYGSYLTYLAGCTDPDYKDEACPDKKGIDQPWVGLTLCDNSDGIWAACSQEGNPSTLQPGSYCSCTDAAKATVAFSDADTLPNTASLPQGTGSSVQYFAGFVPTPPGTTVRETTTAPPPPPLSSKQQPPPPPPPATSPPAPPRPPPPPPPEESSTGEEATTSPEENQTLTTNPASASPSAEPTIGTDSNGNPTTGLAPGTGSGTASNTNGASPGSTNDPSSSPDSSDPNSSNNGGGLSAGAKAGIGVGVAVAVLAFLAVIVALILHHRRKRRAASKANDNLGDMSHTEHGIGGGGTGLGLGGAAAAIGAGHKKNDSIDQPPSDISEADGQPARPWSMRSELEGSVPGGAGGSAAGSRTSKEGHAAHHEGGDDALSPIAELPGSTPAQTTDGRRRVVVGDSVVYL